MKRIAIIAALPGELKALTAGWAHESRSSGIDLWTIEQDETTWVAACGGAGVAAAHRVLREIEYSGTVDAVCSLGWAGALRPEMKPGEVYVVTGVVDAASGERFRATGLGGDCWLVTTSRVALHADKQILAKRFNADLVDMEAAVLARVAHARGLPFYCVKGVSDGLADALPDLNGFIQADGRFQVGRFACFAAVRPWHWGGLIRMARNSAKAARGFRAALAAILSLAA